jgi:hypothetical protein
MFDGSNKNKAYSKVSLDEFSDDDSDSDQEYGGRGRPTAHSSNKGLSSRASSRSSSADPISHQQQQLEMMKRQDEGLDMLSQQAERLGQLSMSINDEITFQNTMLTEMDADLGAAHDDLDFVTRKTKEFIEQSGGWKNFSLILCLSVVVIVLVLLILYS